MTRPLSPEYRAGAKVRVHLPWPDKRLSPNARVHWAQKARAAKQARRDALWATRAAICDPVECDVVRITAVFYPPNNMRRDDDNLIGSIKPYRDGVADALGIDDSRFNVTPRIETASPPHGCVILEIQTDDWEHISEPLARAFGGRK